MKVLLKRPNEKIEELEVENTLESLQSLVNGYIECVPTDISDKLFMIVNEEGKLLGLEPNLRYYNDIIVGNIVFVRVSNNGDFKSISDKQIADIKKYFGTNL